VRALQQEVPRENAAGEVLLVEMSCRFPPRTCATRCGILEPWFQFEMRRQKRICNLQHVAMCSCRGGEFLSMSLRNNMETPRAMKYCARPKEALVAATGVQGVMAHAGIS
jgi:hypothetical protein